MGRHYRASGSRAPTASQSPLVLVGGTTVRPRIREARFWTMGVPSSDSDVQVQLRRSTTAPTGTAVTPAPADSFDPAAIVAATSNNTAEPTYSTGCVVDIGFNPRGTPQWVAMTPDAEIICPATANNGLGAQIINAGGALTTVNSEIGWQE